MTELNNLNGMLFEIEQARMTLRRTRDILADFGRLDMYYSGLVFFKYSSTSDNFQKFFSSILRGVGNFEFFIKSFIFEIFHPTFFSKSGTQRYSSPSIINCIIHPISLVENYNGKSIYRQDGILKKYFQKNTYAILITV